MKLSFLAYVLKRMYEEHELHARRSPDEYWVIDLCRCSMKRALELQYPELLAFRAEPCGRRT